MTALDPTDVEVAAMLHHRHTRKTAGFYWFDTPASRRARRVRQAAARADRLNTERPRPAWQTWNTRNMSDADEVDLLAAFALAGLTLREATT